MFRNFILASLGLLLIGTAYAEGMDDKAYTATLLELNRIRPDQNPALKLGKNQLNVSILDKNLRTLGKVEDIVLAPDGKYETILSSTDTAGFREAVAFDVTSYVINPTPNSFTVSLDKSQLKQNIAKLMADAHVEAREDGPFTIKSLQNGEIYKADSSPVAKVRDVLVDIKAMQVVSLLVTISSGMHKGSVIAIPYEAANAKLQGGRAILTVTDAQAATMQSMATRRY